MKHTLTILLLLLCGTAQAAQYQTDNFIAVHPSAEFAKQVAETAEHYRRELAIYWTGSEFPQWSGKCRITVKSGRLGAGGATAFSFDQGEVFGWRMTVQGSPERILDSVVPHEVNHTIFASYFRRPLPRWYDEGAATTLEHQSEKTRQRQILKQEWRRRYRLNDLFSITEYPRDMHKVMAMYSQSASVAAYLMSKGDAPKFLAFGETALSDGWNDALQQHYGIRNVNELEADWIVWLAKKPPTVRVAKAKPRLIMFGAPWCGPCRTAKRDRKLFENAGYEFVYVELRRDGKSDNPELHNSFYRTLKDADKWQDSMALPIFWIEGTEEYRTGYGGAPPVVMWLENVMHAIFGPLIPNPSITPQEVEPTSDPLLQSIRALRSDVESLKSRNPIEKAKGLFAAKGDIERTLSELSVLREGLKEQVESGTLIADSLEELKETSGLSLENATKATEDAKKLAGDLKAFRESSGIEKIPAALELAKDAAAFKKSMGGVKEDASAAKEFLDAAGSPRNMFWSLVGIIIGAIRKRKAVQVEAA